MVFVTTAVSLGITSAAFGQRRYIDRREHREQVRIREGIRSGELTRREAGRLEAQQARIRVDERFARADGHVSYRERARLDRELDRASRSIYRQKHDRQDRLP
jgi:hypothetical protein